MDTTNGSAAQGDGIKIGTHNGTFHCDEVLACFMLRTLDEYKNAQIVRTRDQSVLDTCNIVVDVGAVFDAEKKRFDHHQRSFTDTMNSLNPKYKWTTKLSSAGLVYFHYGMEIIKSLVKGLVAESELEKTVPLIYSKVYENFVEEIDAIDNGVNMSDGELRYKINSNLSSRVSRINPNWNDEKPDEEAGFYKAMKVVGEEFTSCVTDYVKVWLPARSIVERCFLKRKSVDESGMIVELDQHCPWKEHLFNIERDYALAENELIKYVIYTDQKGKWRLQCVPLGAATFDNRLSIKAEWRGIRDEELSKLSGIPGCIFVHAGGFIGGNETKEGVLQMARESLKSAQ